MNDPAQPNKQATPILLGIDYGERRIGVACTDALGILAQPLEMVAATDTDSALRRVAELAEQKGAARIVVGLARHMRSGDEGETAEAARAFGEKLRASSGLEVVYWDERLTSRLAEQTLDTKLGRSSKKRRKAEKAGRVDVMAASLLLQSYLDAQRHASDSVWAANEENEEDEAGDNDEENV